MPDFELEFDVTVRFVGSEEFRDVIDEDARHSDDPWVNPERLPLDDATLQRLRELEPEILDWLSASPDNAEAFARDPIGALSAIRPDIDRGLISELRRVREEVGAHRPWPEGVRLRSVKVSTPPR